MKKRILIVILVLLLIISLGIYSIIKMAGPEKKSRKEVMAESMDSIDYAVYFVCEELPTDMLWIGKYDGYHEILRYDKELPLRFAEHVDEESLNIREGFKNILIVVNDIDGSVDLSDEEYSLIFNRLLNDSRYNFYYYGSKKLKYVIEEGGYSTENMNSDNISAMYTRVNDTLVLTKGGFTRDDINDGCNLCEGVLTNYMYFKDR